MLSFLGLLGRSTHCAAPLPPGLFQGELKLPFPCCQCLGHRESGVGDFSKKRPGAGAWLAVCSEQEGLACSWAARSVFYFEPLFPKVLLKPASLVPEPLVYWGAVSLCLDNPFSLKLCWHLSQRLPPQRPRPLPPRSQAIPGCAAQRICCGSPCWAEGYMERQEAQLGGKCH